MHYVELENKKRKYKNVYDITHENYQDAGILLDDNTVVVDFDNPTENPRKYEFIIMQLEARYPTFTVSTSRGKHFYYKIPKNVKIKNYNNKVTLGGFKVDYKTGEKNYAVIKQQGELRPMSSDITHLEFEELPELPIILYPIHLKDELVDFKTGDGRNNGLYTALVTAREVYHIQEEDVKNLAEFINTIVFKEQLAYQELQGTLESAINKELKENYIGANNDIFEMAEFLTEKYNTVLYQGILYWRKKRSI